MDRSTVRIAMTVDNGVIGDSRVIKSARSAREAGYDVVVLGYGTGQPDIEGVDVRLFPGLPPKRETSVARWALRNLAMDPGDMRAYRARPRRTGPSGFAERAVVAARWRLNRFAGYGPRELQRIYDAAEKSDPLAERWGIWEHLDPHVANLNRGIVGALVDAEPDIIHVHDYRTLPTASRARYELLRRGRQVRVVYDAHEYVPGLNEIGEKRLRAARLIESRNITTADAVVSVSDALAARMQADHALPELPTVVVNAPATPARRVPGRGLRDRLGLGTDVPLLVYSGSVGSSRVLTHTVDILPLLPTAHVVLVVSHPTSNVMEPLKQRAAELGVLDRFHVTRYVLPEYLVDFLGGADVGLIPLRHTDNVQDSLPSKTYEFLAAGLPQVVSDQRELAAFIRGTGVGEVFEADSAQQMAQAVSAVLSDPERYRGAITAGLKQEWTWESQAVKLIGLYDDLACTLDNPPRQGPAAAGAGADEAPAEARPERFPEVPTGRPSLAVGGTNRDGQATALAHLVEAGQSFGGGNADLRVPNGADADFTDDLTRHLRDSFTHVLLESGATLTGGVAQPVVVCHQVEALEAGGVLVGQLFHGDDLSPGPTLAPERVYEVLETARWLGLPCFVTSPALLEQLPRARWLPMAIAPDPLAERREILSDAVATVLCHPSLKDQPEITRVLRELADDGVIELLEIESASEQTMARIRRLTDVYVDTVSDDGYSAPACHAMAAGCLVLGRVGAAVRRAVEAEVPVVEVDACTVGEKLRELVAEPDRFRAVAAAGPGYIRQMHDGRAARQILTTYLEEYR